MSAAIKALKDFLELAEAAECPMSGAPLQDRILKDLDDTYKEAIKDCISILEVALDNAPKTE